MPERDDDPIASTQMFRAFLNGGDAQPSSRLRARVVALLLTVAVAAAVAVAVAWLIAR
jgi:hypothetical protein